MSRSKLYTKVNMNSASGSIQGSIGANVDANTISLTRNLEFPFPNLEEEMHATYHVKICIYIQQNVDMES